MDFKGIGIQTDATVTRGPISWSYFYLVFGFALAIEGTVIQMTPLLFPDNVATFAAVGLATGYLCLWNGKSQNALLRLRNWYETKPR